VLHDKNEITNDIAIKNNKIAAMIVETPFSIYLHLNQEQLTSVTPETIKSNKADIIKTENLFSNFI